MTHRRAAASAQIDRPERVSWDRTATRGLRERILGGAGRVFCLEPFDRVHVDDVAVAAGVGKGTVYQYCSSKEALYLAALLRGTDELQDRLRHVADARPDPMEQLRALAEELLQFVWARTAFLHPSDVRRGQKNMQRAARRRQRFAQLISNALEEGLTRGIIRSADVHLTTEALLGVLLGIHRHRAAGTAPLAEARAVMDLCLHGESAGPAQDAGADTSRPIAPIAALLFMLSRTVHAQEERTLADCIDFALRHHPALQQGSARVRATPQRIRQAAAAFLPQVDATYSANRRNTSVDARTGTTLGTTTQTFNFFNTGASFNQLLPDFGQALHAVHTAQGDAEAAAADLSSQREQVIFGVKQADFGRLSAQQLRKVAEEAQHQSEKHVELPEERYAVGLASKLDLTRERAQLAANRLNLIQAENNVLLGRETLHTALALDAPVGFSLAEPPYIALPPVDEEALTHKASDLRPELVSLRPQMRRAEQQVAVLERNHLPFLTAAGQYRCSSAEFPLRSNWNVGAAVTLPLFRGGLTVAQFLEAKENVAALGHLESVRQQSVAREVRQALLRVREAEQPIVGAREGSEQAQENFKFAEGPYATGMSSIIEVVDPQGTFVSTRGRKVQASYDFHASVAALEKAVGKALPPEGCPLSISAE